MGQASCSAIQADDVDTADTSGDAFALPALESVQKPDARDEEQPMTKGSAVDVEAVQDTVQVATRSAQAAKEEEGEETDTSRTKMAHTQAVAKTEESSAAGETKPDTAVETKSTAKAKAKAKGKAKVSLRSNSAEQANRSFLQEQLTSLRGDPTARAKACKGIPNTLSGLRNDAGVVAEASKALVQRAVEDDILAVRKAACQALLDLRAFGTKLPEDVLVLATGSLNGKTDVALKAAELLVALGEATPRASQILEKTAAALMYPDSSVKEGACRVIGGLGKVAGEQMAALVHLAITDTGDTTSTRVAARQAISELHAAGVALPAEAISRSLQESGSLQGAMSALMLITELKQEKEHVKDVTRVVASFLQSKDAQQREAACRILGRAGEASLNYGSELAEVATKDEAYEVRVSAVRALGLTGQIAQAQTLVDRYHKDKSKDVREAAIDAVRKLDKSGAKLPSAATKMLAKEGTREGLKGGLGGLM
eukprot:TRINITY_DN17485_c0_g1_i1.p1 TRINITY_DN17485_c0_g1~~TRINITY_DN17485_c0_g1_i1.p1  ORF type:complete len:484 (+),score=142.27 TRINITY_DN17485_c0_g1_i1:45-1496(+)